MKNSNSESLEKKALSDKDINSDSSSEKTEDEIIYNNCIDPEEEEFLESERKSETNIPDENNNISEKIQPEKNLLKYSACKSKFHDYYSPKFDVYRKKRNKPEEVKTADDLFVQAFQKNKTIASTNIEYDKQGNTMSTKISDKIYDKFVGQNCLSGDIIDIAKMKDEESNIKRDALKARENARKINDMIKRQEKYETFKKDRLKERKQLYNDEINQKCVFMPNVNIRNLTKSPKDFFNKEIEFLEKKKEFIKKENKTILEEEKKKQKVALLNKTSEKLASNKNPNESKEQLYQRLHLEKLKNVKVMYKKPEHEKKITKKQATNLINKLYKERLTLKENKEKKMEEIILKETSQDEHISENSNIVLLTKFLNYYNNTLQKIFNRNDNFQINIDEYKLILQHMGCINPNLQSDEALVKESFFNILNPKDDKIDTYTLLLFCLAALGIYKGNDEKKIFESIDTYKYNNNNSSIKSKHNSLNNSTRLSGKKTKSQKIKIKNFNELIKLNMPNLDMDKYGFSKKIAKNINKKFHTFVKGINESWTGDITKKKQERYEKHDSIDQKLPRALSQNKKSNLRNLDNNTKLEINLNEKNKGKNNTLPVNSKNFDELYKRLNQRKEKNNLKSYKNKKELDEMGPCTFQPNVFKSNNNYSKEKNRNKLNSKQIDQNFEKLYQDGKASYLQKKKYSIEPDPEDNLENQINCTFKPKIHQFNNEVFINNPIKDELKKFEKIREQRMSNIANKEFEKTMNFVIEPKLNKEDIIDRVIPERFSYRNNINNNNNNNNDIIEKENEVDNALLKVEVNLDENNNTDKIIIYPGDDVKEKTLQFCQKHKLNEEKKNTLMNIIMEKIEETKNGINEEKNEENNNVNNIEEKNSKNNGEENGNYEYIIAKKENNDEN